LRPGAQLPHGDELQATHVDCALQSDASQWRARVWSRDGEVVSPSPERLKPVRVLCSLALVEPHAQTCVRHGYDANLSQPQHDARHAVTWSDFSQMLFYFSERGHPGPRSFSFSLKLYRKKPDKLRRMQQKQAGET
jgi:hypothetical protein